MPITSISNDVNDRFYFVTPTIWNWYYIFDRHNRWQILADSLKYCQQNKNLEIYSYVFMLNHVHMIIKSPDVSGFLRDFKRHTSTQLFQNIKSTEPNVLELFTKNGTYAFWKQDNKPKLLENEKFFMEKLNYIHNNNPVKKGYVMKPEDWKWSSANPYSEIKVNKTW